MRAEITHSPTHTHMCDSFTQRDDKAHRIYIQYSRLRALFSRSYEVINVLLFLICPEFKAIHLRSRCLAGQTDLEYKTARPTYKHTNTTNRRRAIQSSSFEFIPREIHNLCRKWGAHLACLFCYAWLTKWELEFTDEKKNITFRVLNTHTGRTIWLYIISGMERMISKENIQKKNRTK